MRLFLLLTIPLSLALIPFQEISAQTKTVFGKVLNHLGEPLEAVTVLSKGSDANSTNTNSEGLYQIDVSVRDSILIFSAIGYRTLEAVISGSNELNVSLAESEQNLDEVVVIGYGEQSRETVTHSISRVGQKEFDKAPGQNPLLQLQGKVAGLSLQIQNGQPGSSPQIFIRGGSSTSPEGDAPLFIVDGLVSQGTRSINDLNPDDIESVQVLKDAASTAIYGARAANGIIIVKTKTGKEGKPVVNLRYTHGVEQQMEKL